MGLMLVSIAEMENTRGEDLESYASENSYESLTEIIILDIWVKFREERETK